MSNMSNMSENVSVYKPRKKDIVIQNTTNDIEFIALDWYECDLLNSSQIEKKDSYLNQVHNKLYNIFIFGVTLKGNSVCLKVKNYLPYFYIQIPDEFTDDQIQDLLKCLDVANIEDYNDSEIQTYNDSINGSDYKFADKFKFRSRYYVDSINFDKTTIVEKKIFWTFMNEQKFKFIKLSFKSKTGYQFMERKFKSAVILPIKGKYKTPIKYNLYESDLEPLLRFYHDKKIKPSSWLCVSANKFKLETHQAKTQINISCDWNDLEPLEKTDIPPLLIASFDIEADSSHGDFPIARKDCKKLANQLVISWIRDCRIIEKKSYEKLQNGINKLDNNKVIHINIHIPDELIYIDKKNTEYDNTILHKLQNFITLHTTTPTTTTATTTTTTTTTDNLLSNSNSNSNSKEILYIKEVIKYIKAKQNVENNIEFYDNRIKKALGYEHYKAIDDDIDLIYLKSVLKAKIFVKSTDYVKMLEKINNICNRPIRKIKANTIMKKAQNEVNAIETAKLAKSSRFNIDDLIKIIIEVAHKYNIYERDLLDKIITKDTMVRFVNNELNNSFGFANGDHVIQIGTVFWRYGDSEVCHNNIITLKSCDKFDVGNMPCEIISRELERDVLLEWSKLIDEHDPDIIIGYNIFGFDESFMYDRITDIALNVDRLTLTKDDLRALETNFTYQKFINLGRFSAEMIKKVPDIKGGIVNKQLSSSALGDNFMYYFNMPGRVQIDLLKVCQSSLTKLPSYKLDNVSEFYISGKIKEIIYDKRKPIQHPEHNLEHNPEHNLEHNPEHNHLDMDTTSSYIIKVDNVQELEIGNYIVISMSATTAKLYDGEKLKILDINKQKSYITLDKPIPASCMSYIPLWGMGKDDISPQDIFRLQKGNSKDRSVIAKYCIQDCALLVRLLRKLEVINNNFGMSNVCLVPFSYIFMRGQGIKIFSLITNECAKENFLLPVLEKIEPEEFDVSDNIRQTHLHTAQKTERDDDGVDLVEETNDIIIDDNHTNTNNNNTNNNNNNNTNNTNNTNTLCSSGSSGSGSCSGSSSSGSVRDTNTSVNLEVVDDEKHPSEIKFKLKKNFNQIILTDESYEGALVLKPLADIYTEDPITVLDFSSLYPSEMITSDLSHDRICEDPYWLGDSGIKHLKQLGLSYLDRSYDIFEWVDVNIRAKGKRKCGITTVRFVQYPDGKKGLIPRILMSLLSSRKATKKKMDNEKDPYKKALYDGLQLAYKVTANSVYGQIGARTSKMYKPQIAACTTCGGRERIQHANMFFKKTYENTQIVYGDTDSLFIKFKLLRDDGTLPTTDVEKIEIAIKIGKDAEKQLQKFLPGVHCMSYEKVLFPFILISKKRYFALKYEDDPVKYKQISMGLILKRRDNAPILKHCYLGVLDLLVKEKNICKAIEYIQVECKKMVDGKFDMNMFIISKTLNSYYKDPETIAHAILAQRMNERDPGTKPQSNERIPYVFIKIKEEPNIEYLQGDRIEHINYVRQHNLQPDYEKYIVNQIMKPVSQLFELVIEKIPKFPHGYGYFDEMYNIWYNTYNGDDTKTEKKIKQLKTQMIQKLIFEPLLQYSRLKISKSNTIDSWINKVNTNKLSSNTPVETSLATHIETPPATPVAILVVEKKKHTIAITKMKQLSINKFFT